MRPFRFLTTVDGYPGFAELTSLARKAEAIGCSAFVLPDHLIGQYAPIPLLAVVAAATERLRVGTFVLNACLRHPAVLAQDLATLDSLSGGRVEIAMGAGWNKPEFDAIGIPFEPAGIRVKRLAEAITILKGCFAEGPFSFTGEHYTVTGHDGVPEPAQRPHPPLFLGGCICRRRQADTLRRGFRGLETDEFRVSFGCIGRRASYDGGHAWQRRGRAYRV